MITYLYWVHYPEHTDPFTQGYVGISNNVTARFTYHKSKKCSDNPILHRAILKGAILTIIGEFEHRDDALSEEIRYRSNKNIGWNINQGGGVTPDRTGKPNHFLKEYNRTKVVSKETREKMSIVRKGKKWFTNGVHSIRAAECPAGYRPGRY